MDDPGGKGVVTAHDKMVAARREPGEGRHGRDLNQAVRYPGGLGRIG